MEINRWLIIVLLGLFSISLVNAVNLNVGTVTNNSAINTTININAFPVICDLLDINSNSITFYNLTYNHPYGCATTAPYLLNYTTHNKNISDLTFDYTCNSSVLFNFSICDNSNNVTFLNLSLKDLTTNNDTIGYINNSYFTYYPNGYPNLSKTYQFISTNQNSSFAFCMNPSMYNFNINYTIQYGADGYVSSSKTSDIFTINNISTNDILYLFNASIYHLVTFQIINSFNQPIVNAYVYLINYFDINNTIISSGYTDSGGIIQFMMNSTDSYKIYFSKAGYDDYSLIQKPTDTFYTITMSGLGIPNNAPPDYTGGTTTIPNSKGVTYSTSPKETYLINNTYYLFNYTIDSGTWTLTNWGFNLTDQDNNLINATSSTNVSGGTLSINESTSNYTKVIMNFYYTINGTTTNLQRVWQVLDLSDNQFSISHAIDDITSYINSGLFGITTRGLSFIVFFIIFIGAGVLSYKFGITSPTAILGFVFTAVYFFDVNLGWIPNPLSAVPHFATILTGIVLLGFIIKEVAQ